MSATAMYKTDTKKSYVNIRVNDLTVDGNYVGPVPVPVNIPIANLASDGPPARFIHDDGFNVGKKAIEIPDLQNIGGGAPDGTYLRHNAGSISFENIADNEITPGANGEVLTTVGGLSTWATPSSISPARHITLAQSLGDHTTLSAALAAAVALTPTAANPVEIQCYPGTYSFANPLTIPSYVLLTSLADSANSIVIFSGTNTGTQGFNLSNESAVDGVTITGVKEPLIVSSGIARISNIVSLDNGGAFKVTSGAILVAKTCTVNNNSTLTLSGFQCTNGAKLFGNDLYVRNTGGTINRGYRCNGVGSVMFLDNCNSVGCSKGSVANNSSVINYSAGRTINCTSMAHDSNTGSTINLIAHEIVGTGDHINIDGTSKITASACNLEKSKIIQAPGGQFLATYLDPVAFTFTSVPDLYLQSNPVTNNTETTVLTRNSSTFRVEERDISTLGGFASEIRTGVASAHNTKSVVSFGNNIFTTSPDITYNVGPRSYTPTPGQLYQVTLRFSVTPSVLGASAPEISIEEYPTIGAIAASKLKIGTVGQPEYYEMTFPVPGTNQFRVEFDPKVGGNYGVVAFMIEIRRVV